MEAAEPLDIEQLHQQAIGGSMIAAICGCSTFASPYFTYQRIVGAVGPSEETARMRWGNRLEPLVIAAVKETFGLRTRTLKPLHTDRYGFPMVASLDAMAYGPDGRAPLEAKTQSLWVPDEWRVDPETREIVDCPLAYFLQTSWYMAAYETDFAYVGVLRDGEDPICGIVRRDQAVIDKMLDTAATFWRENVIKRVPPPVDGHRATSAALKEVYRHSTPVEIVLGNEATAWLVAYAAARNNEKQAKAAKVEAQNHLEAAMGEAETAQVGGVRVTWKESTTRRLDTAALKEAEPEIAERYTVETTSRTFRVPEQRSAK